MKQCLILLLSVLLILKVNAQYVYTIKADSVKLTACDSTELIIENHTQGVPGFLFNTGNGRTQFRRALVQMSDTTYLLGGDTLRTTDFSLWRRNGNHIYNVNPGNVGIGRKNPNVLLDLPGPVSIDDTSSYRINYRPMLKTGGWVDVDDYENFNVYGYTNLFTGDSSGTNSSGIYCTMIGDKAGTNNGGDPGFLGDWSTFTGYWAGYNNYGNNNTFMGYQAGMDNTGTNNTFLGSQSGTYNSMDTLYGFSGDNVFIGASTGAVNSGGSNMFIGSNAGHFNYGSFNTLLGAYSGNGCKGNYNMFMGFESGMGSIGDGNILMGFNSGASSNGSNNVLIGSNTGSRNGGDENVLVGYNAGYYVYGGSNTFLGTQSGNNTRGTIGVTLLGGLSGAGVFLRDNNLANAITDATAVGYQAVVNASNTMVFGDSAVHSWLFNTGATPSSGAAMVVGYNNTNGNGAYLTTGGVWTNASDRNKKENFSRLDDNEILAKINLLPVTRWNYKGLSEQHIGPVAQDFHRIFDVGSDDKTISTIDPSGIALAGIQGLYHKWQIAETRVAAQATQIRDQQSEIELLKTKLQQQEDKTQQILDKLNSLAMAINQKTTRKGDVAQSR
jgi:hypothetical protein